MKNQTRSRRSSSQECANIPLPDLTSDVRAFIAQLGDSPREAYLKEMAWTKFVSSETDSPSLRKERAVSKWLAQEGKNAETNERLSSTDAEFQILPHVTYCAFMAFLSSLIESLIGSTPPTEALLGTFSGGASTSRPRTKSAPAGKFTGQAHVTARARDLALTVMEELGTTWSHYVDPDGYLEPHEGNILFTVPKNTTIDRVACKEPDVNMFLQKGVGDYFRSRLRRKGINLNDQSKNQRLARKGSLDGSLATLDLSSASDSVTRELVFQVMPVCWFVLLDSIRSEVTLIGDEEHVNEMFSSMGNGFTFELETLIFWAIARTVSYFRGISGVISVYGDDIIVPTAAAEDLIWVLSYFGFTTNDEKSFYEGTFRESCGGHYDRGVDITPFFIREPVASLRQVILVANSVRAWSGLDHGLSDSHPSARVLDPTLQPLWEYLASFVPLKFWGGTELGSNSQLVTEWCPTEPQQLVSAKVEKLYGLGGYLLWLCTTNQQGDLKPDCTGSEPHLRLVGKWDNADRSVLQWTRRRTYAFVVDREVITSEASDDVEFYVARRARKRSDVAPVIPFIGEPDDTAV